MKRFIKVGTIIFAVVGIIDTIKTIGLLVLLKVAPRTAGRLFYNVGGSVIDMIRPGATNNYDDPIYDVIRDQ